EPIVPYAVITTTARSGWSLLIRLPGVDGVAFEELHRLLSTPHDEHVVSFDLQGALERAQEDLVVLDDQDPVSHRPLLYATSATAGSGDRGMIRRIVVPRPGALSISISPPCRSMIFLTIAMPSPVPVGLVV